MVIIQTGHLMLTCRQSVFGISTMTTPPIVYVYIAVPLLILSLAFTAVFPWALRRFQAYYYAFESRHPRLPRQNFTMLGDELPDSADVPRNVNLGMRPSGAQRSTVPSSHSESRPRVRFVQTELERTKHRHDEKV